MEHTSEDCQCEGKKCTKCPEVRCLGNYAKDKRRKGGLTSWCKVCKKEYIKTYRQKNAESIKTYVSQWGKKNRPRIMEKQREWACNNREKHLAIARAGDAKRRARKTLAGGSYTAQEWRDLKAKHNHACLRCGRKEPEIKLAADHVIPIVKGGTSFIENIQPLCMPCNIWKRSEVIDFRPKTS